MEAKPGTYLNNTKQLCSIFESEYDVTKVIDDLLEYMKDRDLLSASAYEIGVSHDLVAVGNPNTPDEVLFLIEPKIVDLSKETEYNTEKSGESPNFLLKVKRAKTIRVRYKHSGNEVTSNTFSGITAALIQHECDVINGIDWKSRASRYHKEKAKKLQRKIERGIVSVKRLGK